MVANGVIVELTAGQVSAYITWLKRVLSLLRVPAYAGGALRDHETGTGGEAFSRNPPKAHEPAPANAVSLCQGDTKARDRATGLDRAQPPSGLAAPLQPPARRHR